MSGWEFLHVGGCLNFAHFGPFFVPKQPKFVKFLRPYPPTQVTQLGSDFEAKTLTIPSLIWVCPSQLVPAVNNGLGFNAY